MGVLFGPVLSNRLGVSLGIDIVKDGHCSYDCIYCEAGKTKVKTLEPAGSVTPDIVMDSLSFYLSRNKGKIDYLTFSGTGEPTLNPYIGDIIKQIKRKYKIPLCLLTNSSLLSDHNLVKAISKCDLIMPSLDAVSDDLFIKLNRPAPGVYVELILIGLKKLIKIAKGKVIVEILLVKGFNDTPKELRLLSETIRDLNPHGVVLNTVFRNPVTKVQGLTRQELNEIGKQYFKGFIYQFKEKKIDSDNLPEYHPNDIKFKKMLYIRGVTLNELCMMFKKMPKDMLKEIDKYIQNDDRYYTTERDGILRLHYDFKK